MAARGADPDAGAGADAGPRLESPGALDHPRARRVRRDRLGDPGPGVRGRRSRPTSAASSRASTAQRITLPGRRFHRPGDARRLGVETFDHIIVLCYDTLDPSRADARTLITLLHLRDIAARLDQRLLDRQRDAGPARPRARGGGPRRRLHRQRPADQPDDRAGRRVEAPQRGLRRPARPGGLRDLPEAGRRLRAPGQAVPFAAVIEAARRRGEIAFGYRIAARAEDAAAAYGVSVNPAKAASATFARPTGSSSSPRTDRCPSTRVRRTTAGPGDARAGFRAPSVGDAHAMGRPAVRPLADRAGRDPAARPRRAGARPVRRARLPRASCRSGWRTSAHAVCRRHRSRAPSRSSTSGPTCGTRGARASGSSAWTPAAGSRSRAPGRRSTCRISRQRCRSGACARSWTIARSGSTTAVRRPGSRPGIARSGRSSSRRPVRSRRS